MVKIRGRLREGGMAERGGQREETVRNHIFISVKSGKINHWLGCSAWLLVSDEMNWLPGWFDFQIVL